MPADSVMNIAALSATTKINKIIVVVIINNYRK